MKKNLILFCFSIAAFSCAKTSGLIDKNQVTGKWLLKEYAGGIGYHVYTPTDSTILNFDGAGKYTSTINDTVKDKGSFDITTVSPDDDYYGSKTIINLFSDNNYKTIYGIQISNDSLFLREGYADGYVYTYTKQQ